MPGLWDTHVHFGGGPALVEENKQLLGLYLAHGITTVRDCAGDLSDTVLDWRDMINQGKLVGPTILASGPKLEGYKPLWKGTIEVGTPEEVSKALDYLQSRSVDFVKITENTMKPEIFLEAVRQARARGMQTSGHLPVQLTLDQVMQAGLGSIEHQSYALRGATPREAELTAQVAAGKLTGREAMRASLESFDEATARATFRRMAAAGMSITPTLVGSQVTAYLDQDDHANDPYLKYIGKGLRKTYEWRVQRAAKDDAAAIAYRHASYEKAASLLPLLQQEGVNIIAGTDAGFLNSFDYPGQGLHDELGIFVKYGLTPQQALQASVINGPRFLGKQERYGAVPKARQPTCWCWTPIRCRTSPTPARCAWWSATARCSTAASWTQCWKPRAAMRKNIRRRLTLKLRRAGLSRSWRCRSSSCPSSHRKPVWLPRGPDRKSPPSGRAA